MFKRILVPTDGSEFSTETVRRAASFAKEAGAEITAFFAKPDIVATSCYGEGAFILSRSLADNASLYEEDAQKILGVVEDACREAGVTCNKVTMVSNLIYEGIIKAATDNNCDLIFMASHGRSGIGGLLLGSETQKVLTHSKIPVLVYR